MLVTQITTHVDDAFARRAQQFKAIRAQYTLELNSSDTQIRVSMFSAILAAYVNEIQNLESGIFPLDRERQLYDGTTFPAAGVQLDGIGELVGIARNGLEDDEYRLFILAKIAENFSDGTIETMLTVATLLFQLPSVTLLEMFPAEVDFQIPNTTPLDPSLFYTAAGILQKTVGAGIGLGFITAYNQVNPFMFTSVSGPALGGGFGSTSGPGGGEFAGLIFNNPGA